MATLGIFQANPITRGSRPGVELLHNYGILIGRKNGVSQALSELLKGCEVARPKHEPLLESSILGRHPRRVRAQERKARRAGSLLRMIQDSGIPPHEPLDQTAILFRRAMQFDKHVAAAQRLHYIWGEQTELAPIDVAKDQGPLAAHEIHKLGAAAPIETRYPV